MEQLEFIMYRHGADRQAQGDEEAVSPQEVLSSAVRHEDGPMF